MASVNGKVYFDINQNDTYEAGEPPIPGVTLVLWNASECLYTTTDASGEYEFDSVPDPGDYTLRCSVENTGSCTPTPPSEVPEGYDFATGLTEYPVSVAVAGDVVTHDFGYFKVFDATKTSNVPAVVVGQTYEYTITVTNYDSNVLESVVVSDPLDNDIKFVSGSVTVDGLPYLAADIMAGVDIGSVAAASGTTYPSKVVKFKVEAVQKTADIIENQSTIVTTYYEPGNSELQSKTHYTNIEQVELLEPKITITKMPDKDSVKINDIITYTIMITNSGDTILTDVKYKDTISDAVELVEDSVVLNGEQLQNADLEAGINVDIYNPGDTAVLTYQVKVIGGSCSGFITNKAYATYRYVLESGTTGTGISDPVCVDVKADIALFKQITIDTACHVPSAKPDIEEMDNISIEAEIYNSYVIKTPKTVTNEDQVLSGYKLVVHGTLNVVVQYTAYCRNHSVHSAHYNLPFSSFIILPPDYVMGTPIEVSAIVEHAGTEVVGKREIFINVALLLIANIA